MANNPNAVANLKPAKKGEPSRNPAGRPKGSKSAKTRALEMLAAISEDKEPMTPIFKALLTVLNGEEVKDSDRLKAADMLMDRIEGKAVARVEQKTEDLTPSLIKLTGPDDRSKD